MNKNNTDFTHKCDEVESQPQIGFLSPDIKGKNYVEPEVVHVVSSPTADVLKQLPFCRRWFTRYLICYYGTKYYVVANLHAVAHYFMVRPEVVAGLLFAVNTII